MAELSAVGNFAQRHFEQHSRTTPGPEREARVSRNPRCSPEDGLDRAETLGDPVVDVGEHGTPVATKANHTARFWWHQCSERCEPTSPQLWVLLAAVIGEAPFSIRSTRRVAPSLPSRSNDSKPGVKLASTCVLDDHNASAHSQTLLVIDRQFELDTALFHTERNEPLQLQLVRILPDGITSGADKSDGWLQKIQ